jgi:hypothetical protein
LNILRTVRLFFYLLDKREHTRLELSAPFKFIRGILDSLLDELLKQPKGILPQKQRLRALKKTTLILKTG